MSINDIAKQLAKQYGGDILGLKPKAPEPVVRESLEATRYARPSDYPRPASSYHNTLSAAIPIPKRPTVRFGSFTEQEIDEMFSIPVKKSWTFQDYLEVIGLPRDLHKTKDVLMYQAAESAFLIKKQQAHRG
jgi:hypothetical protein